MFTSEETKMKRCRRARSFFHFYKLAPRSILTSEGFLRQGNSRLSIGSVVRSLRCSKFSVFEVGVFSFEISHVFDDFLRHAFV